MAVVLAVPRPAAAANPGPEGHAATEPGPDTANDAATDAATGPELPPGLAVPDAASAPRAGNGPATLDTDSSEPATVSGDAE